nr:HAD-IIIA family hydrolase [Asticcacaulis solisilvae]
MVVLVGGRGTRLGKLAENCPKPLMKITEQKVFLDYFLESAVRQGFRDVLLLAGHLGEQVQSRYDHASIGGAHISVVIEPEPRGTGGAFAFVRDRLASTFIAANGDTLFDTNIRAVDAALHGSPDTLGVLALRKVENAGRFGSVNVDGDGRILSFQEKTAESEGQPGLINGGIYALRLEAIDRLKHFPSSIEADLFPQLASEGRLRGVESSGYFLDIGLPETYSRAVTELPARKRPVLFLDRDGVLNHDHGYVHAQDRWEWVPGAIRTIKAANDAGYAVVVVTNQAGIARGYYDECDVWKLHHAVQKELYRHGAFVDAFYYSPYHKDAVHEPYRVQAALDRKPGGAMIQRAFRQMNLSREGAFLLGDQESDVDAATSAGISGYRFPGGDLYEWFATLPHSQPIVSESRI